MIASHPFGTQITTQQLLDSFAPLKQWEDRYRQLIQLSRQLPALSDEYKQPNNEISGCENRVWLNGEQRPDGSLHFYGDSEGRIVRGLLAILLVSLEGKTATQVIASNPLQFFNELGIGQQLSASRAQGLEGLAAQAKIIAQRYLAP